MTLFLVALDGSESALRALAQARDEATQVPGSALHLLTVHVPWISDRATGADIERVTRVAKIYHEWAIGQARAILDAEGPPYTCESMAGDPADCILKKAGELGCTAIYLGAHGMGFTRGSESGSTAIRVGQLSPVPVRIVD